MNPNFPDRLLDTGASRHPFYRRNCRVHCPAISAGGDDARPAISCLRSKRMPDILHLIKLSEPASKIYSALTTADGIRSWWTADADLEDRIGGFGEFRFYDGSRITKVEIVNLVEPVRVVWRVVSSFRPEWTNTEITFDLHEGSDGTTLRFYHRGYPHADDDFVICTTGWGIYLGRLQQYLRSGEASLT